MKDKLIELHNKLTESYGEILEAGCEDPRILKEVREFLSDNSIFVDNILDDNKPMEVIELDLDDSLLSKYKEANG